MSGPAYIEKRTDRPEDVVAGRRNKDLEMKGDIFHPKTVTSEL